MRTESPVQPAAWLRLDGPRDRDIPGDTQAWIALAQTAAQSGLAGLMLQRASCRGLDLPSMVLSHWRQAALSTASRNLHFACELRKMLALAIERGIEIMLLKGAALLPTIYERPELRPMSDLDLLVRSAAVDSAIHLLEDLGFQRGKALLQEDFFPKFYYETEFYLPSVRPVRVDLHVRPFRPMPLAQTIPDDAIWHDAQRLKLDDQTAWIPSSASMFIHLTAHAAFHGCDRPLWLYDIKRFAESVPMKWPIVIQRAKEWGILTAVRQAVISATHALGEFCPADFIAELARHRPDWRERWMLAQAPRDAVSPICHVFCNAVCSKGWGNRLAYLRAVALPGRTHFEGLRNVRSPGAMVMALTRRTARAVLRPVLSLIPRLPGAVGR